jgi:hypothetical protein
MRTPDVRSEESKENLQNTKSDLHSEYLSVPTSVIERERESKTIE